MIECFSLATVFPYIVVPGIYCRPGRVLLRENYADTFRKLAQQRHVCHRQRSRR